MTSAERESQTRATIEAFEAIEASLSDMWTHSQSSHDGLEDAKSAYRKALTTSKSLSPCAASELDDQVSNTLERMEEAARTYAGDSTLSPTRLGRGLAVLRAQTRLIRRLTRKLHNLPPRDELPFILSELRETQAGLSLGTSKQDDAVDQPEEPVLSTLGHLEEEVIRLRHRVVWTQIEKRLEAARKITTVTSKNAVDVYASARSLNATRAQLLSQAKELRDTDEERFSAFDRSIRDERHRLEEAFFQHVADLSPDEALSLLLQAAPSILDEIDEARVTSIDTTALDRLAYLEDLNAQGVRFAVTYRAAWKRASKTSQYDATMTRRARRMRRRLGTQTRRLRNLISDRRLARRLECLFGRRLVKGWETFVFWLIMLVLGLIVIDHYREPDPEGVIGWTIWADTAICGILLLDFGVRLTLSPNRVRYFLRNLFTEFLPSIPFGLLANLEHLGLISSVRALRLVRVFRVLRVIRPFLRIIRLMLFLARAADRLVERYAWVLNHNIIFFSQSTGQDEVPVLLRRIRDLDKWITRETSSIFADLGKSARAESGTWRAAFIEVEMQSDPGDSLVHGFHQKGTASEVDVEAAIRFLRELDEDQVSELLGFEFAVELNSSLRVLRLPLLRRLPVVGFILGPDGAPNPLGVTARLGNVLGDALGLLHRFVNWFADLYGIVTGAQFLDRVGLQLVQATSRPAKRLLTFGVITGVVMALVELARLPFLGDLANGLVKFLSMPVLILGGLCLLPLVLGIWLRKIAGRVADFYDRVAQAQFLALTEVDKERRLDKDLHILTERALAPEVAPLESHERETLHKEVRDVLDASLLNRGSSRPLSKDLLEGRLEWRACDEVLLFYREYLDGSLFHANDTKIANILIGNLTLENIRLNRLGNSPRDIRRLNRLNLGNRGGFLGPCLWFRFITHSIAHHTAALILKYNQFCIPLDELETADPVDLERFEAFKERSHQVIDARRRGVVLTQLEDQRLAPKLGTLTYRTTEFNALHFLTADPEREEAVERRFGKEVRELMTDDRRNLILDVFGTYPMHRFSKERRTFNPYEFYGANFARGRIFIFPFILMGMLFKGTRILISQVIRIVREVIDPHSKTPELQVGPAKFKVARRKIHRMRRPIVMEALRLRASFDVEYLGLRLPDLPAAIQRGNLLIDDLRTLNASEREWEEFRRLRSEREHQVRLLSRWMRAICGPDKNARELLVEYRPKLQGRERIAIRAIIIAFTCDHEGLCSLADAYDLLREILETDLEPPKRRVFFPSLLRRRISALLEKHWSVLSADLEVDAERRSRYLEALIRGNRKTVPALLALDEHLPQDQDPRRYVFQRLLRVGEQASSWSEQLLAARTIQSLGMLDLQGYEESIRILGRYDESPYEADESSPSPPGP